MVLYKNLKNLSIGHEPISLNLAYYINVDLNIFKITINFIYLSVWTEDIYIYAFSVSARHGLRTHVWVFQFFRTPTQK